MTRIDAILNKLGGSVLAKGPLLVGTSAEAIAHVERALSVRFPSSYRAFLLFAGVSAGDFLMGTAISINDLEDNKAAAESLIRNDGGKWKLPEEALVIAVHQGYQFLYLACSSDDENPPVFHSMEGEPPTLAAPTFEDWLDRTIDEEIEAGGD